MMNIQKLCSQESIGVKYIGDIYANFFFENFGLKAIVIFVILLSQDRFKCNPETNFHTITL